MPTRRDVNLGILSTMAAATAATKGLAQPALGTFDALLERELLGVIKLFPACFRLAQESEKGLLVWETGRRFRGFMTGHDASGA